VLWIGWRPEERHPAVLRDRDETPDVLVEVHGLSIAGNRNSDVTQMGDGPESQGHEIRSSRGTERIAGNSQLSTEPHIFTNNDL
jgi:hypothetical protein